MPTAHPVRPKVSRRQKKYPPLSREQQNLVAEHKWIAGRLAHGAKCLTGGHTGSLTRDDLESIANFALCVAATRYRPEMNIKFSTYAWNTARGYIRHALRDYSRMVRTPRWVASYKTEVKTLIKDGMTYSEISEKMGIDETRVFLCDMSSNNYHVSYDSNPEDWVTKEFIFHDDEAKAALISKTLVKEMKSMTDAEMSIMMKYVEETTLSEEEREWAAERFHELSAIAHGFTELED
jgi:DNA-directed RNA polymerase specialized sigma subunit